MYPSTESEMMNRAKNKWHRVALLGMSGIFSLMLAGCGDDSTQPTKVDKTSHTVSVSEHQAFEKKYAEVCVKAQQVSASDQDLGKICDCIAQEISKRLSKADAVHFLEKGEFPFDLVMMTNAAENTCTAGKK
jgi:hypothetical protein